MKRNVNILLMVVVAVCAVSLWQALNREPAKPDRAVAESPLTTLPSAPRSAAEARPPWLTADQVNIHLVILNGTKVAGLARDVSLALSATGCVTQRIGNAPHDDFTNSLLVNRRLAAKQADQLAQRLGGIQVIEEKDSRTHEDALLVLGADYRTILAALGMSTAKGEGAN
jgi:hypothetical protein